MSKKLDNKIRMVESVHIVLDRYENVWVKSKAFSFEVEASKEFLAQLQENRMMAQLKSKGATKSKASIRSQLETMCVELAGRAHVYAKKKKDEELKEAFTVYISYLKDMSGNELLAKLQSTYQLLNNLSSALEQYDVTKENLEDFRKLTEQFKVLIPKPRGIQVARKNHNRNTKELMGMIKDSFENMDDLITGFKNKDF